MMIEQKRGRNIAIAGGICQLVFAIVILAVYLTTGSKTAMSLVWLLTGGVVLWLMAALLFYCRQLEQREQQEFEEFEARGIDQSAIFEDEPLHARPAAARVAWMNRWIVPTFTLLWSLFQAGSALVILRGLSVMGDGEPLTNASASVVFTVLIAFIGFLLSRYATGMGTQANWRPLRATGSYLLLCTVMMAVATVSLLASTGGYSKVDGVLAYLAPLIQLVLAVELLLNFILDIYRPRMAGQEERVSYDSRLLGLMAQPERVGHSIAETLNYQFGFEVSSTWFYQLLSRAMVPLVALGAAILVLMSAVVIVPAGHEAIVSHFGKMKPDTLKPGLGFKWPWPVDSIRLIDKSQVYELRLGAGKKADEDQLRRSYVNGMKMFVWSEEHGDHEEQDFLVASPGRDDQAIDDGEGGTKAPDVQLIKLVVLAHYQIEDVVAYARKYRRVDKLLEDLSYREMGQYCASATLMEKVGPDGAGRPEAIMTFGRRQAGQDLQARIQAAADRLELGVRIIDANLVTAHPPAEVAPAFEMILAAERGRDTDRYSAEKDANERLTGLAGSPSKALMLAMSIRVGANLERLKDSVGDQAAFNGIVEEMNALLAKEIKITDGQIAAEKLLGKVKRGDLAHRSTLIDYRDNLLAEIAKNPTTFDFDKAIAQAQARTDELFSFAVGEPALLVAAARSDRWREELTERARFESFGREIYPYRASPEVYLTERWLDVLDRYVPNIPKYVLAVDPSNVELRVNLEEEIGYMSGAVGGGG